MPHVEAFAIEDTAVQLVWRDAPSGPVKVSINGHPAHHVGDEASSGPGGMSVAGLEPQADHEAHVEFSRGGTEITRFRTLATPPGPETCRIATVGDLHIGQKSFGRRGAMTESGYHAEPIAVRCLRMALADAVAWGAQLVVVKGDVTNNGRRLQWRQTAEALHECAVPVLVLPGNHDTSPFRSTESWLAAKEYDLDVVRTVRHIDLPGIRVVTGTTTIPHRSRGRLAHRTDELVALAADAPAALVLLHHQLELLPDLPLWPPGIPRAQADQFLDRLAAAQPRSLVSSGHTHRNRRRQHGPVEITQVGSTKDYPGGWAGYAVHEHGIRQVIRRTLDPRCMRWTDLTRTALLGGWGLISPGRLSSRCFTHPWPGAPFD